MPRKRPSRAAKKAATTRAVERSKAKFWVPPSLAQDGGTSRGRTTTPKKAATPKPKFWTPEQLALKERADFERWEGGGGSRWKIEELENGVKLVWYWHGGQRPGGLAVVGLPGHARRISVYVTAGQPMYADRVLSELDPKHHATAAGWCQSCESATCDGVQWASAKLVRVNPLPF